MTGRVSAMENSSMSKLFSVQPEHIHGAVSCGQGKGWVQPWRLPLPLKPLFFPEDGLMRKAECPAGARLRFRTRARQFALIAEPAAEARQFDLAIGNEILDTAVLPAGVDRADFSGLAGQTQTYEIWLPQMHPVKLRHFLLPENAGLEPAPDTRPRWTAYGSSITQCGAAHSPARTWPAAAARRLDLNLTCLGFGGNCHLEPVAGMMIRDLPADIITLKLGINVQGAGSLSRRTFQPAVIGLARIIRERHPETPIGLITPIHSPPRETAPNVAEMTLQDYRDEVKRGWRFSPAWNCWVRKTPAACPMDFILTGMATS